MATAAETHSTTIASGGDWQPTESTMNASQTLANRSILEPSPFLPVLETNSASALSSRCYQVNKKNKKNIYITESTKQGGCGSASAWICIQFSSWIRIHNLNAERSRRISLPEKCMESINNCYFIKFKKQMLVLMWIYLNKFFNKYFLQSLKSHHSFVKLDPDPNLH